MSDHAHEHHTGPIKTPAQLLWTSFFAFVAPVFIIIGLVYYVTSGDKPAAGAMDQELATAQRIQRVGTVELRDANRPLQSGEAVYAAQCLACHGAGLAGAPKFGDAGAWAARIATGYEALLTSALKGKGAMGAQAGGAFTDVEIGRAVVHMANAAGGKFAVPEAPAAAAPVAEATAAPVAAAASAAPAAAPMSAAPGAPKSGDKAAWAPRIAQGIDALTASAIKGKGAMPPKGGSAASDAEIRAAVQFMVDAAR
jgi:cytochrome c5